jgi:cytochrome c2
LLRRFLPTLILLVALLAVGGLALNNYLAGPPIYRGAYVPTLSADPQTAQVEALAFMGILFLIISGTIGTGVILALLFVRLTKMLNTQAAASAVEAAAPRGPAAGSKAPAKSGELGVPLSSERSAAIFWIVLVVIVVGFLVVRSWGQPIGYLPGLSDLAQIQVFKLPGTHIDGLPSWIAGPGDPVTALQLLIGVLVNVLIATVVTGFILARGFGRLSQGVREADKYKSTPVDRLIPEVEGRLNKLRQPGPRTFRPRNPIDDALIGINVLLLLVIGGLVAFYVVPSYGSVAAVDQAVEATRVAALVTPTPAGPGPEQGGSEVDALMAEFNALPAGDAAGGQGVFTGAGGCSACHSLQEGQVVVGPSLHGVGTRAGTERPGFPPEAYLYESITNPNAFVVPGFPPGVMPQTFKQVLSAQQLADVIAFLKTQ